MPKITRSFSLNPELHKEILAFLDSSENSSLTIRKALLLLMEKEGVEDPGTRLIDVSEKLDDIYHEVKNLSQRTRLGPPAPIPITTGQGTGLQSLGKKINQERKQIPVDESDPDLAESIENLDQLGE